MPPIRSVTIEPDSVTIVTSTKGTIALTRAQIPANVLNKPLATIEQFVNDSLDAQLAGALTIRVHIFSVSPTLVWTYGCWNAGLPSTWTSSRRKKRRSLVPIT